MIDQYQQLTLLNKSVLQRVVFKPPFKAKEEMIGESCFIYSIRGNSTVYGDTERQYLHSREGVLMKCGRFINQWHANDDGGLNEAVVMHLYPDVLKLIYDGSTPDFLIKQNDLPAKAIQVLKYNEALENYILGLRFYFDNPQLADDNLLKLKLKELVLLLYKSGNQMFRDLLGSLFDERKSSFREIINNHIFEPISVEDLAYLTHLSLSTFKRKFRASFQNSPAKFIRTKRLEKASDLLKYSDKRIADISYECGFSDPKVFTKSFKMNFGVSPSTFRKSH
ncbi:MAG: AraC family transcriptional regulator, partial [Bacteroidota bacterium]